MLFSDIQTIIQTERSCVPHWITKRHVVLSTAWRRKKQWTHPLFLHKQILIRKLVLTDNCTSRHRTLVQTFALGQVLILSLLNPEIYGGDASASRSVRLTSRKRVFGRYFLGGCLRPTDGVEFLEKRANFFPCWQLNHCSSVHLILVHLQSDQYFVPKSWVDNDGVPHPGRTNTLTQGSANF
jgi:hypothetical protein